MNANEKIRVTRILVEAFFAFSFAGRVKPEIAAVAGCDYDEQYSAFVLPGYVAADESGERVEYPDAKGGEEAAQAYVDNGEWDEARSHVITTWRVALYAEGGEIHEEKIEVGTYTVEPNVEA